GAVTRGPLGNGHAPERPTKRDDHAPTSTAKAVHPLKGEDLAISVQQVLSVEPLFQADVRAQVAGVVRSVPVGIGTRVSLGATLVEIDVPQLEAEVVQKRAVVNQREIEVLQAEAAVANAIAFRQVAERTISQRIAEK